ncbi:MAG: hypothetical protein GY862_10650 [Gammaproteobacteria bacterium]|nr:hypothetical protein [Gammaproteobacteria bacterium]
MNFFRLIFPRESRAFPGIRWVKISFRTLHLLGIAGLGGAFLYSAPREFWMPYLMLTAASGFALMLLDIWSNGIWLIQLRGIAIVIKLLLFFSLPLFGGFEHYVFIAILIISGVISHAPGDIRYFSIFHGRRIESLF